MMKNDFGITVMYWGKDQVTGTDEQGRTFCVKPEYDGSGKLLFWLGEEPHYAGQFRTLPLKLPIYKYMEVSTAHIQEKTNTFLRDTAESMAATNLIVYAKGEFGYWIFVDTGLTGIPEDLFALIQVADQKECIWLILDRDGIIVEGLPTWEW